MTTINLPKFNLSISNLVHACNISHANTSAVLDKKCLFLNISNLIHAHSYQRNARMVINKEVLKIMLKVPAGFIVYRCCVWVVCTGLHFMYEYIIYTIFYNLHSNYLVHTHIHHQYCTG